MTSESPTLASISHFLSEFVSLLPSVHTLLWSWTQERNPSDVLVMDALHRESVNGFPGLQAVLERLLWNCNQMMYRHLSAWCARQVQ